MKLEDKKNILLKKEMKFTWWSCRI